MSKMETNLNVTCRRIFFFRAGGRSPRYQRHRASAEERLSLVRLPARWFSPQFRPAHGSRTTIGNCSKLGGAKAAAFVLRGKGRSSLAVCRRKRASFDLTDN